jgi:hypothetical protein
MKKIDFTYDIEKYEKFFYNQLSEKDKRLFVGLEAMKAGYYGVAEVSVKFSVNKHTVRRGKSELLNEQLPDNKRIRKEGGGRKKRQ